MIGSDDERLPGYRRETDRDSTVRALFNALELVRKELADSRTDIAVIQTEMTQMHGELGKLVTRLEFAPVKLIAYGIASVVLSTVLIAILYQVVRHA